jgi:ring-1,2-phenylacetyl-CoA epoxidase subunit PaaD
MPLSLPTSTPDEATVWSWLESVCDPEIPVVNLREMGILREVRVVNDEVEVHLTPTYSGCPALSQMQADVLNQLQHQGVKARVVVQLSPAWTTDWMTDTARDKLRAYGIAPPGRCQHPLPGQGSLAVVHLVRHLCDEDEPVPCPRCGSTHTQQTSVFGSTACKSLHRCLSCHEPFDHFKAI